ncbi:MULTISPECIES: non-oxidative hydroxyarylic acid decarboxylases subunit C [unclassified Paenibacillus]|uniref:non-oxidative hydroxyarylic acid decarboxylases subunit C n=1 Tax=unclassified Paenibacillus TaxID=185978 RepID=UPI001AE8509F|nr:MULTISPECIES: non-oxidative hydroxyarylic acid decarboxylases subunit C [unclassified Paenibacillus]MBP1157172.1 UbiD family decarboxylase [Paenibacillus sp. PvP091]MBP1172089.1 UbiD family decarboxylase [Paenibacillus sp. PvR098]MBP2438470.1 UbiD family decarboxylase [Paenibacillus sp. PvP052]
MSIAINSLRDFLQLLSDHKQCITWPNEVMPEPDIRNIGAAAGNDAMNGPAIVFDQIRGYPGKKLVLGVHGSFTNLALLLGHAKGTTIQELFYDMAARWDSQKGEILYIDPDKSPVHEVRIEQEINLYDLLPLYRINEYDGGFYLAKASVVSQDPVDPDDFNKQNVGIYRLQIHGPDLLSLMTIPSHDIGKQIMMAEKNNLPLKIAVMLGNHPGMTLFAGTPLHYEESEYLYASAMMGNPIKLTKSGNGLDILADSEMVIEAELVLNERILEGPFGEFPGTYSGVRKAPVFRVTAISHRKDPIFENIYIGKGWTEHDTLIGLNTSVPIYSTLKKMFPEVKAVNAFYQHGLTAVISVENRYGGFAKSVAMSALGTPHGLMYLKNLIMVDQDVDPFDLNQVMWALSTRTRANDIIVIPNMPMVPIDPSAEVPGKGHHLIIDATSFAKPDKIGEESAMITPPEGKAIEDLTKLIKSLQER